jgi:opacity protein-like surface antigen
MLKSLIILPALLLASAASAQDTGWTYRATLYGWVPAMTTSVDTQFGTIEGSGSGSGSSSLSDLQMAFMGTFSAQNGPLGFAADLLYADLSNTQATPFNLFGDATVGVQLSALSAYALYRVSGASPVLVDLGGGFRTYDLNLAVDLSAGSGALGQPATSQSYEARWTDPLLAARLTVPLNEKWFLDGFADFGGVSSDSQTYQVYGGVGYKFNPSWSTQLGYRYMSLSHPIDAGNVTVGLSGFLVAVSYDF